MTGEIRPPRLAQLLLLSSLSVEDREHFLSDLEELFAARVERIGIKHARLFYWTQTFWVVVSRPSSFAMALAAVGGPLILFSASLALVWGEHDSEPWLQSGAMLVSTAALVNVAVYYYMMERLAWSLNSLERATSTDEPFDLDLKEGAERKAWPKTDRAQHKVGDDRQRPG